MAINFFSWKAGRGVLHLQEQHSVLRAGDGERRQESGGGTAESTAEICSLHWQQWFFFCLLQDTVWSQSPVRSSASGAFFPSSGQQAGPPIEQWWVISQNREKGWGTRMHKRTWDGIDRQSWKHEDCERRLKLQISLGFNIHLPLN